MNIGDDVTINGTIVYVSKLTDTVVVRTKTGDELNVYRKDNKGNYACEKWECEFEDIKEIREVTEE